MLHISHFCVEDPWRCFHSNPFFKKRQGVLHISHFCVLHDQRSKPGPIGSCNFSVYSPKPQAIFFKKARRGAAYFPLSCGRPMAMFQSRAPTAQGGSDGSILNSLFLLKRQYQDPLLGGGKSWVFGVFWWFFGGFWLKNHGY